MSWSLSEDRITDIVKDALKEVADFDDNLDVNTIDLGRFQEYHRRVLIAALKTRLLHTHPLGYEQYCIDVVLNESKFNAWGTVGELIDYIHREQSLADSAGKVQL